MTTQQTNNPDYVTVYNEDGRVTRTHVPSGKQWHWTSRPKERKRFYRARNGVTVDSLVEDGLKVRVKHFRLARYLGQMEKLKPRESHMFEARVIVIPASFRKDPMYHVLSRGGYTHISIQSKDGKYICLSSECAEQDTFCYRLGIAKALERLTDTEMELLKLK